MSLFDLFTSVRDYGALGDGITDDTAAINTAYEETDYVYFPEGVYLHDQINLSSGKWSYGRSAALKKKPSEEYQESFYITGGSGYLWDSLIIDGSADGERNTITNTGCGIKFANQYITNWTLRRMLIKNVHSDGLYFGNIDETRQHNGRILDTVFEDCGRQGTAIVSASGIELRNVIYKQARMNFEGAVSNDGDLKDIVVNGAFVEYDHGADYGDAGSLTINGTGANGICKNIMLNNVHLKGQDAKLALWNSQSNVENLSIKGLKITNSDYGIQIHERDGTSFEGIRYIDDPVFINCSEEGNWENFKLT